MIQVTQRRIADNRLHSFIFIHLINEKAFGLHDKMKIEPQRIIHSGISQHRNNMTLSLIAAQIIRITVFGKTLYKRIRTEKSQ